MRLNGRVAVVTGGSSGIGLAIARRFVAEGAKVVITGRRQKELDAAVASVGGAIVGLQSDVAVAADREMLRAEVERLHGRVDVMVANAGIPGNIAPFGQVTEEQFDQMVGVNLKGTFFSVQTLLPLMPDGSAIILLGSISANTGLAASNIYAATKAGIRSFARTWTTDLKVRKIRVNTLTPGHTLTPMADGWANTEEKRNAYHNAIAKQAPAGRMGMPEEIAGAAVFLASDDSSYVTGIELVADGGITQV